ncbi:hypothetical protein [Streptomyces sp. NPDC059378]|uniref:hypothetical protein n=1 Tax=Streptomyces sp. NPDC059378 TaxID=3346815 RepID=UPI0036A9055A
MDDDNAVTRRGTWRWARIAVPVAASALALGGCGSGDHGKAAAPSSSAPSGSVAATASGSSSGAGSAGSARSDAPSPTPFRADPARVPRTSSRAQALAAAVALQPRGWGADFRAQRPAVSTPGTLAVLDTQCRWERHELPGGVLASLSRYSEIPAAGGKGEVKVSAAVTVHTTVRDADERLATTLEEPLRCRQQEVRTDEWISKLISTASPYGTGNNTYADDQVVEIGKYLTGKSEQTYGWYVTRLGTVTLSVSVKGAKGYSDDELITYASNANAAMLTRLESELGGDS